ncbi:MAG: hypothetical protein Q9222_004135 [Ikaeria aurantiellina]
METAPPAWLRSYKAQSAIIPNFASQVRHDVDHKPAIAPLPEHPSTRPAEPQNHEQWKRKSTGVDHFTFPSTISLTLHDGSTLEKCYSNSTPNSSPKKSSFPRYSQEQRGRAYSTPIQSSEVRSRPRGPLCRFFASIRNLLTAKTQNTFTH